MLISLENYIDEKFETVLPEVVISTDRVECSMYQGENFKGRFEINADKEIQGFLTVSSPRMTCSCVSFAGTNNIIEYEFDSRGMSEGDVIKGKFEIICNGGEYSLPFVATIEKCHIASSMGSIKNLFHFANLAQNSWNEALKIFESKDFFRIFTNHDKQYMTLYEGLMGNADKNYALEQFLIAIRKKEPVVFHIEKETENFREVTFDLRENIPITKKNWGYFEIKVVSEVDFLVPCKSYLHEEDFVGSVCPFQYYIKHEKLHQGKNMGRIQFLTPEQKMEVCICVEKAREEGKKSKRDKTLSLRLMELYIGFRTKKNNSHVWIKESLDVIEKGKSAMIQEDMLNLYQAQLLLAEKKKEDAWYLLKNVIDARTLKRNGGEAYCYYLYLLALAEQKEIARDKALQAVTENLSRNRNSWKLLWLKLYLQEDYELNRQKKYEDIKKFCNRGCTSPVIYMEAVNILKKDAGILKRLDEFECYVLYWAVRNEQMTEEMAEQVVYLATKQNDFHPVLYKVLKACYAKFPRRETIQAMCSLLIRNDKREKKYFFWYDLGVFSDLKITRLYEYYLMTIDTKVKISIPRNVLMYFLYQCDLDYRKKAYLYVNLMKNREMYPELYEKYLEQIYDFAQKEIMERHINEDLAYIYKQVIIKEHIDEKQADALVSIMFTHKVKVKGENVQQIVVRHKALYFEETFSCSNQEAYVNIYHDFYVLLGVDYDGRRFPVEVSEEPKRLYRDDEVENWCFGIAKHEIGIYIHKLMDKGAYLKVEKENINQLRSLSKSLIVKPEEKREFCRKIADYYYEEGKLEELDNYLMEVELEELQNKDRTHMVEYMIMRKMYEKSYYYIKTYGADGISSKLLLRICSLFLREYREEYQEDVEFCRLCHALYHKGKYDVELLDYLIEHYQGNLSQMRELWKSSKEFELENYQLEERILVQSLFAHSYVEDLIDIFEDYVRQGARASVEKAFIIHQSYEYFVKQNITEDRILEHLYRKFAQGEILPDICKAALLLNYSEKPEKMKEGEKVLKPLVMEFLEKRMCFEFLRKYPYEIPQATLLQDKTVLEYRTRSFVETEIYYMYDDEEGDYKVEKLKSAYEGIGTAEFILFFGETLQYYLKECGAEENVVASGKLLRTENLSQNGDSRYHMINDMLISKAMQDEKTLQILLDKYLKTSYMVKEIFSVK